MDSARKALDFNAYILPLTAIRDQDSLWVLEYESLRLLGTLHTPLRHNTSTRHLFWASGAISGLATAIDTGTTPKVSQSWFKAMYLRLTLSKSIGEKSPVSPDLSRLNGNLALALGYLIHLSSAWLIADTLHDENAQQLLEAELAYAVRRIGAGRESK
ncbi:hypothetical protein G3M48_005412 [Beauveria asiatica]|uniref:Uncharacterized protein n=1 Tax=Beauveria asiatica TaxID=1069075 RepID=A0AAW0RRS0_9HYPO